MRLSGTSPVTLSRARFDSVASTRVVRVREHTSCPVSCSAKEPGMKPDDVVRRYRVRHHGNHQRGPQSAAAQVPHVQARRGLPRPRHKARASRPRSRANLCSSTCRRRARHGHDMGATERGADDGCFVGRITQADYMLRPSNGVGSRVAMSMSSRQRTLSATISLPSGEVPRENAPTPHCAQNR